MTKEQAQKEYEKIISDSNKKELEIIENAKATGVWKPGLDANMDLLKPIKEETRRKLEALKTKITEQ